MQIEREKSHKYKWDMRAKGYKFSKTPRYTYTYVFKLIIIYKSIQISTRNYDIKHPGGSTCNKHMIIYILLTSLQDTYLIAQTLHENTEFLLIWVAGNDFLSSNM